MTTTEERVCEIERLSQRLSDHTMVTADDLEFIKQWEGRVAKAKQKTVRNKTTAKSRWWPLSERARKLVVTFAALSFITSFGIVWSESIFSWLMNNIELILCFAFLFAGVPLIIGIAFWLGRIYFTDPV